MSEIWIETVAGGLYEFGGLLEGVFTIGEKNYIRIISKHTAAEFGVKKNVIDIFIFHDISFVQELHKKLLEKIAKYLTQLSDSDEIYRDITKSVNEISQAPLYIKISDLLKEIESEKQ
jgi:hypothetical protein